MKISIQITFFSFLFFLELYRRQDGEVLDVVGREHGRVRINEDNADCQRLGTRRARLHRRRRL